MAMRRGSKSKSPAAAANGRDATPPPSEGTRTTVREHVAASRALRELGRRERAKMREIRF